jgi:hypothetical protein
VSLNVVTIVLVLCRIDRRPLAALGLGKAASGTEASHSAGLGESASESAAPTSP